MKCPSATRTAGCSSARSRSKKAGIASRTASLFSGTCIELRTKNLAIAITRKVRGRQQARRHARREHLPIPGPVILLDDGSRVLSREHLADALLDELEGLPIPARGHGVALL